MKELAPILLFTYKRLDTLQKTIEALRANQLSKESILYIFSDGAKSENDISAIQAVRAYLKTIVGFKNIHIKESETNKGLAKSIISGVSEIMKITDQVIVMEDDLITTPNFLSFMNKALTKYETEPKVFSISGYSMNLGQENHQSNETYFLNRSWSWGWASWKDRWEKVDWDMKDYDSFKKDKVRKKEFAKGGSDLNKMLRGQMEGKLDSWAIRWLYEQHKVQGLTLYPVYSKVYNDGFDEMATHTTGSNSRFLPVLDKEFSHEITFPNSVALNVEKQAAFMKIMSVKSRIRSKIDFLLQSILN